MHERRTTLERAFELAKTGDFHRFSDLKTRLLAEGYADAASQLYGPSLRRQLTALCTAARAKTL